MKDRFFTDVLAHELIIIRDAGAYRHLRFKKPDTSNMYFDLLTWPGHLCFTGDMGSYLFSRVRDMFGFFRDDRLRINPQYWAEKVLAQDREGIQQWSDKLFREMAIERVTTHFEDVPSTRRDALSELTEDVLPYAEEEWEAAPAYMNFSYGGFHSEAEDLSSCYEYTFRYLWCCHAIVWGIQQYDTASTAVETS